MILLHLISLLIPASGAAPSASQAAPATAFALPIACRIGVDCEIQNYVDRDPGPGAHDYRCGSRTYDAHSGLDIRLRDMAAQRAGVAVLAAADGVVLRVRDGVRDVSVKEIGQAAVEGGECGNGVVIDHGGQLTTQYCHLRNGSVAVGPGDRVRAGQAIAGVGLSGDTEYPHLHFTIRRGVEVIDPFAPGNASQAGRCGAGQDLWTAEARAALAYRPRVVLNTGFTTGAIGMAEIEAGDPPGPAADGPALVAYVRAIGLQAGDVQSLTLTSPSGEVLARSQPEVLPRNQAQRLIFVGKRRPASWTPGPYTAAYTVTHDGRIVLETRFSTRF